MHGCMYRLTQFILVHVLYNALHRRSTTCIKDPSRYNVNAAFLMAKIYLFLYLAIHLAARSIYLPIYDS